MHVLVGHCWHEHLVKLHLYRALHMHPGTTLSLLGTDGLTLSGNICMYTLMTMHQTLDRYICSSIMHVLEHVDIQRHRQACAHVT